MELDARQYENALLPIFIHMDEEDSKHAENFLRSFRLPS